MVDWDAEITRAQADGENAAMLAERVGRSVAAVWRALRNRGQRLNGPRKPWSPRKPRKPKKTRFDWPSEIARANADGETAAMLARRLDCDHSAVRAALRRNRLKLDASGGTARRGIDWDVEIAGAVANEETVAALARRLGCSRDSAVDQLLRRNVSLQRKTTRAQLGRRRRSDWEAEVARANRDRESAGMLARRLGCSPGTIYQALRRHGLALTTRAPR